MSNNDGKLAPLLVSLEEAAELERAEAGGKAAVLARMRRAGFPVPDGYVFTARAMLRHMDGLETPTEESVRERPLDEETRAAVAEAAARLTGPLAVRSSGIDEDGEHASHAGQYSTVLGVEGEEALDEALRTCWASGLSATVRSYRSSSSARDDAPLAVLVQRLVPADTAGVAFTVNPVTGARDEILVSGAPGLGEGLVSGEVSSDDWVVPAGGEGAPVNTVSHHDALTADEVREIAALAEQVAGVMGGPTDIEWARAGGTLFLLQARPITAIADPAPEAVPIEVEPPQGFWTKDSTHISLPLLPMTRGVMNWGTYDNAALQDVCAEFGLLMKGMAFQTIGGWRHVATVPLAPADISARIRAGVEAAHADQVGQAIDEWLESERPRFAERITRLRTVDLASLSDRELTDHLADVHALHRRATEVHFRVVAAVAIALGRFGLFVTSALGGDPTRPFVFLAGLSTESTGPAREMAKLAGMAEKLLDGPADLASLRGLLETHQDFADAFEAYRSEHGCRALQYELANPALAERPELILSLLRDQLARDADLDEKGSMAEQSRREAVAQAREQLAGTPQQARFDELLAGAERAYPIREDNEYWTVSAPNALVRWAALEVAGRMVQRGLLDRADHVFFLEIEELSHAFTDGTDGTDVRATVVRRRGEHRWALENPGPASYGERPGPPPSMDQLPAEVRETMGAFQWALMHVNGGAPASQDGDGQVVTGVPGSSGRYTGMVRVVRDESEFDKLRAGDVLVCPTTSPVWSVVFPSIGALVTDVGGALSHAAIIAREYGIPAVLSTGGATGMLADGMLVTVDGDTGVVTIEDR